MVTTLYGFHLFSRRLQEVFFGRQFLNFVNFGGFAPQKTLILHLHEEKFLAKVQFVGASLLSLNSLSGTTSTTSTTSTKSKKSTKSTKSKESTENTESTESTEHTKSTESTETSEST